MIDPEQDSRWDQYVDQHPQGTIFHHSKWLKILNQSFRQLKTLCCIVEDDAHHIVGLLPICLIKSPVTGKRMVSLPFTIYSDPLVDSPKTFSRLNDSILKEFSGNHSSFLLFRVHHETALFDQSDYRDYVGFKNHLLNLDQDIATIRSHFHKDCIQRSIRRAENAGLRMTEASNEDDLKIFYKLYFMTRKKVGLPPHPYRFFRIIWNVLKPASMVFILIAWHEKRPIAAILCFKYHGRVHYEYIGVDYQYMRFNPNIFLLWNAIKVSHEEKNRFFEFGSSAINNAGLIQFKERWGTVEEDIHHFYYPEINGISSKTSTSTRYKLLSTMVRHMPNWLLDQTGRFCYRHAGG